MNIGALLLLRVMIRIKNTYYPFSIAADLTALPRYIQAYSLTMCQPTSKKDRHAFSADKRINKAQRFTVYNFSSMIEIDKHYGLFNAR